MTNTQIDTMENVFCGAVLLGFTAWIVFRAASGLRRVSKAREDAERAERLRREGMR